MPRKRSDECRWEKYGTKTARGARTGMTFGPVPPDIPYSLFYRTPIP